MLSDVELLKIKLMVDGMRVDQKAREKFTGKESLKPLSLNDYASTSGISLKIEGNIWVNAPIAEYNPNFVDEDKTEIVFSCDDEGYFIKEGNLKVRCWPVSVPKYHSEKNRWGEPYTNYAITHTDRVRISPIQGCSYVCTFCDLPYDKRYTKMSAEGLVDSVAKALEDSWAPAEHVLISGGVPRPEDFDYLNNVYEKVCGSFPDTEVDIMMTPVPGLLDPRHLYDIGVNELSINIELYNEELAKKIMPRKAKLTLKHFLDFIEDSVAIFGVGKIRSLILVGIEPIEDTLRGVEELAKRGCLPVLSPFRPDPVTPMKNAPTSSVEDLVYVYEKSREIVEKYGVYLGTTCAPCAHNTMTLPKDMPTDHERFDFTPKLVEAV